jgi:hypothetical protein
VAGPLQVFVTVLANGGYSYYLIRQLRLAGAATAGSAELPENDYCRASYDADARNSLLAAPVDNETESGFEHRLQFPATHGEPTGLDDTPSNGAASASPLPNPLASPASSRRGGSANNSGAAHEALHVPPRSWSRRSSAYGGSPTGGSPTSPGGILGMTPQCAPRACLLNIRRQQLAVQ